MIVKQISVALKNKPGALSKVSDLLGDERINVRALMVTFGNPFSTVRLIVDEPDKAIELLETEGYELETQDVLAVETPNHPGGLNAMLKPFMEAGINVLYLYPFIGTFQDNAILVIGVDQTEQAISVLGKNYIRVMGEELFKH